MCRTIRINPQDAARALRAIPSERRAEASRANGRRNPKGHGGRPKFKPDEYKLLVYSDANPAGELAGSVRVLDDAAEVALTFLRPGETLRAFRGASATATAQWECDVNKIVRRVMPSGRA